jgi:hypothetical protein
MRAHTTPTNTLRTFRGTTLRWRILRATPSIAPGTATQSSPLWSCPGEWYSWNSEPVGLPKREPCKRGSVCVGVCLRVCVHVCVCTCGCVC